LPNRLKDGEFVKDKYNYCYRQGTIRIGNKRKFKFYSKKELIKTLKEFECTGLYITVSFDEKLGIRDYSK